MAFLHKTILWQKVGRFLAVRGSSEATKVEDELITMPGPSITFNDDYKHKKRRKKFATHGRSVTCNSTQNVSLLLTAFVDPGLARGLRSDFGVKRFFHLVFPFVR